MKKTLALLLALVSLFVLCACNTKNDKTDDGINKGDGNKTNINVTTGTGSEPGSENSVSSNILSIDKFYGDWARVNTRTGYGYIDKNGNIVIEPIYLEAQLAFDEELARVKTKEGYAFIDRTGKEIFNVNFKFKKVGEYKNGAFWIETPKDNSIDSQITYYDSTGKKLFTLDGFRVGKEELAYFNEYGYAFVEEDSWATNYYRMIDKNGLVKVNGYRSEFYFSSEMIGNFVTMHGEHENGKYSEETAYINFETQTLEYRKLVDNIDTGWHIYKNYYLCMESKDVESKDGNIAVWEYRIYEIDATQKIEVLNINDILDKLSIYAIEATYARFNENEYFILRVSEDIHKYFDDIYQYAIIDIKGNILMDLTDLTSKYDIGYITEKQSLGYTENIYTPYPFASNGLCKAKDANTGLFGFIDLTGKWVIQPQYNSVTDFSDGENPVAVVNDSTIINSKGEVVFIAEKTTKID